MESKMNMISALIQRSGVIVDEFGCPVDSDRDNVPDFLDKCPNTPSNVQVDVNGCPVDLDKDGIPDYLDLCKDTPLGVPVDDRGCSSIKLKLLIWIYLKM